MVGAVLEKGTLGAFSGKEKSGDPGNIKEHPWGR